MPGGRLAGPSSGYDQVRTYRAAHIQTPPFLQASFRNAYDLRLRWLWRIASRADATLLRTTKIGSVRRRTEGRGARDQASVLAYPDTAPGLPGCRSASVLSKDPHEKKTPARCRRFGTGGARSAAVLSISTVPFSGLFGPVSYTHLNHHR